MKSTAERNPNLMAAVRAYARAAIRESAARGRPPQGFLMPNEVWVRQGERSYVRQRADRFVRVGFRDTEQLHELPEYASALAQLEADPVIGPQLDKLVGTPVSAMRISKDQLLDSIAVLSIAEGALEFDEDRFIEAYRAEESELCANKVEFVAVAPVAGVVESPPLHFGSIEFDRMTEEETSALLDTGLLQSMLGGFGGVAFLNTEYVLRMRYELPRVMRDSQEQPPADPLAGVPNVSEACLDVVLAMRVLKPEPVGLTGVLTLHGVRGGGRAMSWGSLGTGPLIRVPEYRLNEADAQEVVALWAQLKTEAVRKRGFLGTAVRRFAYAGERTRVEDRFVDLMIAAEAMFLGEKRKDETSGELAYKISTRFAYFAHVPDTSRRERFEHMRAAYRARSAIVHGDKVRGLKTTGELERFTTRIGEYLRVALRAMIAEAEAHPERKQLVDWDEFILGPRDRTDVVES